MVSRLITTPHKLVQFLTRFDLLPRSHDLDLALVQVIGRYIVPESSEYPLYLRGVNWSLSLRRHGPYIVVQLEVPLEYIQRHIAYDGMQLGVPICLSEDRPWLTFPR